MNAIKVGIAIAALLLASAAAQADVSISNKPTQNMSCDAGICTATAQKAVLNVGDLQTMLASGDVAVKTGGVTNNINIDQPLTWTSTSRLTLDAQQSVVVKKPVTVAGTGALTITTNDRGQNGDFIIEDQANIRFWELASSLIINGKSYALVGDIKALATRIAEDQNGEYALANDYDAAGDGVYSDSVVSSDFEGTFEGLGHTIANLSVSGSGRLVGLFSQVGVLDQSAALRDVRLTDAAIQAGDDALAGPLAGANRGSTINARCSGHVRAGKRGSVGGLIGYNSGADAGSIVRSSSTADVAAGAHSNAGGLVGWGRTIFYSRATGSVIAGAGSLVGGLAGFSDGFFDSPAYIAKSYATGSVSGQRPQNSLAIGGLVGQIGQYEHIMDSYATGTVSTGETGEAAGLIGYTTAEWIRTSYSAGLVIGPQQTPKSRHSWVAGFIGGIGAGETDHDYWDVDVSGQTNACQDQDKCPGVAGLSDAQLKSGLPAGFDPKIWRQSPSINKGYPYLLANPPPK